MAHASLFKEWMQKYGQMCALFQEKPAPFLEKLNDILIELRGIDRSEVEQLISQRTQAREEKDWEKSDQVRDQLTALGIEVHDGQGASAWSVKI